MNNIGTRPLETERLILRRFTEADAQELFEGYVNQKGFLYYANKKKRTLQEEIESLKGIDRKYDDLQYYNWLITLKDNKRIIGAIHLNVFSSDESVEFNYATDERYRGNGYMTEALEAVRDFCINDMKVRRIFGGCEVNNTASRRVMEKCSFRYEKTLHDHLELRDGCHDMHVYSITMDEE